MAVRLRLCIPWLLVGVAVWPAAAWAQRPGGAGRGFSFDRLLKRYDKDNDGKVTREEWQGPERLFGRMDGNNDGAVTKEEFQARMRARGGRGSAGGIGEGRGASDGSGSRPETSPALDVAGLLRRLDADKDGSLSSEEVKKFFLRADSDNSGSLSKEELAKALAPPPAGGPKKIDGPSVVEGQPAGIEVGQCAPDFELQPIEPYAKLREWLGDDAPKSIEEKVRLSQLVGKQPILLLYGSYT